MVNAAYGNKEANTSWQQISKEEGTLLHYIGIIKKLHDGFTEPIRQALVTAYFITDSESNSTHHTNKKDCMLPDNIVDDCAENNILNQDKENILRIKSLITRRAHSD